MPISRGLPSKTLEELMSELEVGELTTGEPAEQQAAQVLPPAGEFLRADLGGSALDGDADWTPIDMGS